MIRALADASKVKTWKRETAWAILAFLGVIVWQAAQHDPVEALRIIVYPAMLYVGAAFGMEWASKQTNLTGGRHDG